MLCMTKTYPKRLREFRRSRITSQLMTRAAGRDIAAAGFRACRVATIASCMRVKARWYGKRDAASRWAMTGRAAYATHIQVARVIEFHPKTLQAGKRFQRTRLHISMANCTDRTIGIRKLLRVTSGTRQVARSARTFWDRRIGFAPMAQQAREARMIATAVHKLSVVQPFRKLHLFLRRLCCDRFSVWISQRVRLQNDDDTQTG